MSRFVLRSLTPLAIAMSMLTLSTQAQAGCPWYDLKCSVFDPIADAANKARQAVDSANDSLRDFGYKVYDMTDANLKQGVDALNSLKNRINSLRTDLANAERSLTKAKDAANYARGQVKACELKSKSCIGMDNARKALRNAESSQKNWESTVSQLKNSDIPNALQAVQNKANEVAGAAISTAESEAMVKQLADYAAAQAANQGKDINRRAVNNANYIKGTLANLAQDLRNEMLRQAARVSVANHAGALNAIHGGFDRLDASGTAALNRIRRAIPAAVIEGKVTEQVRNDLLTVARQVGLAGAAPNVPGNVGRSSFSVSLAADGSVVAGVASSFGLAINLFAENGKNRIAVIETLGGSLGAQVGVGLQVVAGWAPSPVQELEGPSLGLCLSGQYGVGFSACGNFGINQLGSIWSGSVPVPSYSFGAGAGVEVKGGPSIVGEATLVLAQY